MEIEKFIKPDLLKDNAINVVEEEVRHDFTEQEIIDLKDELFTVYRFQDIRQSALELIKEVFTKDRDTTEIINIFRMVEKKDLGQKGIKSLKSDMKEKLQMINRGYTILLKKLYAFPYYELERMAFYEEDGNYVYDRPMKPNEMQLEIPGAKLTKLG
jgi:hypothetical protein